MKGSIKKRWGLTVSLVLFVFAIMMAAMMLAGLLIVILHFAGAVSFFGDANRGGGGGSPFGAIAGIMFFSVLLGTAITGFFSRKALNPIRKVIDARVKSQFCGRLSMSDSNPVWLNCESVFVS